MTRLLYLAAIACLLGVSSSAVAQGTGIGGGTGTSGGSGFGGGTGTSGGSGLGGGTGASGGTTFSGGGNSLSGGQGMTGGTGTGTVPGRTGAGGRAVGGSAGVSISPTNFLGATYGNPLYNGRPGSTNISLTQGGGFGQPSFGAVTTTTANGTTTLRAGQAGTLGRRGTATVNSSGAIGSPGPAISYALDVKFPVPPIAAPQVQASLQGLISRTTAIKQPGLVVVSIEGDTAILRGRVADDDERRLVEGMMRMEPGIRQVRNELIFP